MHVWWHLQLQALGLAEEDALVDGGGYRDDGHMNERPKFGLPHGGMIAM
jgi:hypothetical protein